MFARTLKLEKQSELAECGLACLTMIARYHGASTDLAAMRRRFEPSLRGTSLKTLSGVANSIGLIPRAIQLPLEELEDLSLPAILHWDMSHYVVLSRIRGRTYTIYDPANGILRMSRRAVSDHFTGVALELRASSLFDVPPTTRKLRPSQLWSGLTGLKRILGQVVVLSLIIEVLGLVVPYYLQVGVDTIVPAGDLSLLSSLGMVFLFLTVIQGVVSLTRSTVLVRSGAQMGYGLAVNLSRHLLRLPISWYQRRMLGDIIGRLSSTDPIQDTLTRGASLSVIDGIFATITLAVMFIYSHVLCIVVLVAVCTDFMAKYLISGRRAASEQEVIEALGREQTTVIECLRGITSIRMLGKEHQRHLIWQDQRSDVVNAQTSEAQLRSVGDALSTTISNAENVLSVWISVAFVITGELSVGMVFAYFTLRAMFWGKALSLINQAVQLRMTRLHLARLEDIVLSSEDKVFSENIRENDESFDELELVDVTYRYSSDEPNILRGINLKVKRGQHVAITGLSGGGKSTLIRIILGLVEPTTGSIKVNGTPIAEFGYRNYYKLVSSVIQDDTLFTGSLADNISMFSERVEIENVETASKAAAILNDVRAMPMGFRTLVGDMGSSLSSGQRQRILIARALYRVPQLLVMDEGTSHLDSLHEAEIAANLQSLSTTRITVAHRDETLRHADLRYRLEAGLLVAEASEGAA